MNQIKFNELNLSQEIHRAIEEIGFEIATEIQSKAIPPIMDGHDTIGKSQTGTGKTLAFGIPALEKIQDNVSGVQVLILCPTRELVIQVYDELTKISKYKQNIRMVDVYGGASIEKQIFKLKRANIVVGTPGRVIDHTRRRTLKLNNLKMVILDEADEMLSMGFREDIETILNETPKERQTILFSATMPPEISLLTHKYQQDPEFIETNKKQISVSNISQFYYDVSLGQKINCLHLILKFHNPKLAMIFCNTKKMVDEITEYLSKHGFNVAGIHGDMKQSQRIKVMNSFKQGTTNILVATDIAARGIDVNNIDYVINYDIPQNTEYYIHRIGRTGRAGKSGVAITICSGNRQAKSLSQIVKLINSKITFSEIPSIEQINKRIHQREIDSIEEIIKISSNTPKISIVEELISKGYDSKIIAAAILEKYMSKPLYKICEVKAVKKKSSFNPCSDYRKIVINLGHLNKISPNHIVGAITSKTDLSGDNIGKIEIRKNETIVSVPSNSVNQVVDQMKNCKIHGNLAIIKAYKSSKIK